MVAQSKDWPHLAGLLGDKDAPIGLLGAPMIKDSVTPCAYDKGPAKFRKILHKISTYDVETGIDLKDTHIRDYGDAGIASLSTANSFKPLLEAFAPIVEKHDLSILIGGHNGITRSGVHACDNTLKSLGLLTLDAHFDLRSTDDGLMNGNPVLALLEDGLPGEHIVQIGLAPFANSAMMHSRAIKEGINVYTLADIRKNGIAQTVSTGLKTLGRKCKFIYVDFDIDVIDRALSPGAPGGRSGGISPPEFFEATRLIGAHLGVKAVDLTEFNPSQDVNDTTALITGRWFAEILSGFIQR